MPRRIAIDFETYYDQDYSLTNLTTQEYILDPRFEILGFSFAIDDQQPQWVPWRNPALGEKILRALQLDSCAALAHQGFFDFGILALHFGIHPKLMLDTRMMANPIVRPYQRSVALGVLAEHFALPSKGDTVIAMKGRHLADLSDAELAAYGDYCVHDTWLCREIFKRLRPKLPSTELVFIHRVLEMFTKPKLLLDAGTLAEALAEEEQAKDKLLTQCGAFEKSDLMSNDKFAAILSIMGVNPPKKVSPRTHKSTWAFSKQDLNFIALLDHDNPMVRILVEARLAVRSTQRETRARRLQTLANLLDGSPFAVPLMYYAAHTRRLGGTDSLNLQNLPRGSKLRHALRAPPGYKIVAGDLSQIEARLTAHFCGETWLLNAFRAGEDVYAITAGEVFGIPGLTKDTHPGERFVGKVAELQLGFGSGAATFAKMLLTSGQELPQVSGGILALAERTVYGYRDSHPSIVIMWSRLQNALGTTLHRGSSRTTSIGPLLFYEESIELDGYGRLFYNDLRLRQVTKVDSLGKEYTKAEHTYQYGGETRTLYGAKILENIIQWLARLVIRDHMLKIAPLYPIVLQVHDELVSVVRDEEVDEAVAMFNEVMSKPPLWAPDLPVACEVKVGQTYLEAK